MKKEVITVGAIVALCCAALLLRQDKAHTATAPASERDSAQSGASRSVAAGVSQVPDGAPEDGGSGAPRLRSAERTPIEPQRSATVDAEAARASSTLDEPVGELVAAFVRGGTGEPIEGLDVRLTHCGADGLRGEPLVAVTDRLGEVRWPSLAPGELYVECESIYFEPFEQRVRLGQDAGSLGRFELTPYPLKRVELLGAIADDYSEYSVKRLRGEGRVPVATDGVALLPWPEGTGNEIMVDCPGSLEISALFPLSYEFENPFLVRVGAGAGLDLGVVGALEEVTPIITVLHFESSLGYEGFVTNFASVGAIQAFDCLESGAVDVEVGVKRSDSTLLALGRATAQVSDGSRTALNVDIGSERTYVAFERELGVRVESGNLFLESSKGTKHAASGGRLDDFGRLVVPTQETKELWVSGRIEVSGESVAVVDVPLFVDTRAGGQTVCTLGPVIETRVEILEALSQRRLGGSVVELYGRESGRFGTDWEMGPPGAATRILWCERSDAAIVLPWSSLWSPRAPIPLRAGDMQVEVVLRAECTFVCSGGEIGDLKHVPTGLEKAALLQHEGVQIVAVSGGWHCVGVPAGDYLVRLSGADDWRGPFLVPNNGPTRVVVSGG